MSVGSMQQGSRVAPSSSGSASPPVSPGERVSPGDRVLASNWASNWFVINTQPHREALAIDNLHRQDFNVYCPMLMKRIRHARRVYEAPRPLFPGYVFVEHLPQPYGQQWRPILGTYGVRSVIRHGDTPALLNGEFIERLKAREVAGVIRKPERPFQVGQQVGIRGGPFDGLAGQILEMRENERIVVLIDLLNQRTKVHIGAELLNPV